MADNLETYKEYFERAIKAAGYAITGGEKYLWNSFGPNARFLDFDYDLERRISMGLVFDSKNQSLYQGSLFVGDKAYLWTNPEYVKAYKEECYDRDIDPRVALDNTHYLDCDVFEDFIEKITEAFTVGQCSPFVKMSIEFSPDVQAFMDSQPEDFDLDAFVNDALRREVSDFAQKSENNVRAILKEMESMDLDEAYISLDAVVGRGNVQEIVSWIKSILPESKYLRIDYSNKEVREGLRHTLTAGFQEFSYFYKD